QKEQNAIIRNTGDRILVIQGTAGSGKTSIALHRIAYLLYHDREHLRSANVLVLSPNSVFSDYISHILPELGEENIQEMSFDLFAYRELREIVSDCEDRYDWLERQMGAADEEETKRYRWKQSEAFVGETEGFLAQLEDRLVDFRLVKFRGMEMSEQEIIQMFYFKFQDTPLLARMNMIMEYFVDAWETLHDKDLSEEDRASVQAQFDSMYVTRDVYEVYQWLLEDCGCPALPAVPWEKRKLRYEDVFPMLYLKYRLQGKAAHRNIKHLVIDEMQDYSYLQYEILKNLFSCRMTILGDRAQTLDDEAQDVLTFLPGILGRDMKKIILNKSYRNTVEISEYARKLVDMPPLEQFERHGKAVEENTFSSLEDAVKCAAGFLRLHEIPKARRREAAKDPSTAERFFETAAILTQTEREAEWVYAILRKLQIPAALVDRNSSTFPRGLTVTTYYLAKGLEFDQVFGITEDAESPFLRQVRYICATRALHELYMYRYQAMKR
ncbi:MAG TPA: UvrD-helicase domain-containing protein, partial [Candidatus Fusicatenibacter merdavium]|nr:UvrD-helicase domain-containing protein [Candidatus Fusicatenibacter merdavium]